MINQFTINYYRHIGKRAGQATVRDDKRQLAYWLGMLERALDKEFKADKEACQNAYQEAYNAALNVGAAPVRPNRFPLVAVNPVAFTALERLEAPCR